MSTTHHVDSGHDQPPTETPEAAEALCDRLMNQTGDLLSLLDRETSYLQRGKAHMAIFRRDAALVRAAAPERVDSIRDQHQLLQKSLKTNQDALAAMKAVTESLLHTIAATAGERSKGPEVYGKDAGLSPAAPVGGAAISVDTTL